MECVDLLVNVFNEGWEVGGSRATRLTGSSTVRREHSGHALAIGILQVTRLSGDTKIERERVDKEVAS